MRDIYEKKMEESVLQDTGNVMNNSCDMEEEQQPMKLIDQACWNKITYNYGVIGPEIMFFCQQQDFLSNFMMPDLDPI